MNLGLDSSNNPTSLHSYQVLVPQKIDRSVRMAFKMTRKILIVNPNTTQAMTDALKPLVQNLDFENVSGAFAMSLSAYMMHASLFLPQKSQSN